MLIAVQWCRVRAASTNKNFVEEMMRATGGVSAAQNSETDESILDDHISQIVKSPAEPNFPRSYRARYVDRSNYN